VDHRGAVVNQGANAVQQTHDEHLNPAGVKGLGEIGICGTAAAIANAVWHATGVRHRDLPIRPDRVLMSARA
jgi:CO/xanthine dehydrogenase Mo-binding subunit